MIQIIQIPTGNIQENCYLVSNQDHILIVDPGDEASRLKSTIDKMDKKPEAILITHAHYDHIGAVDELRKHYNIPVYISGIEQDWLSDATLNLSGLDRHNDIQDIVTSPAEYELEPYQNYQLGGISFKVVPTPGHSPGSLSFIFDTFVICGDALFKGSVGRTDLPFGNSEQLLHSIQTELFNLDDELEVYPGHGPKTTIGYEKQTNPFFN